MDQLVAEVIREVEITREIQEAAERQRAVIEKEILDRHASMVAAADQARDEALKAMKAEIAEVEDNIAKKLKRQQDSLDQLMASHQQLQQAIIDAGGSDDDNDTVNE